MASACIMAVGDAGWTSQLPSCSGRCARRGVPQPAMYRIVAVDDSHSHLSTTARVSQATTLISAARLRRPDRERSISQQRYPRPERLSPERLSPARGSRRGLPLRLVCTEAAEHGRSTPRLAPGCVHPLELRPSSHAGWALQQHSSWRQSLSGCRRESREREQQPPNGGALAGVGRSGPRRPSPPRRRPASATT